MALQNGNLLYDRYRIEETIAQGGMGAIYRATDLSLDIRVAVKENFFGSEEAIRQFKYEARILANLRHPNLPRVTDHFEIEGQGQYLVMDYIDGKDLKDILAEKGAISEAEAIRIGKAVCRALDYLHSRIPPIIHRDIKPGNIKITSNQEIYLVDFGLAKQAGDGEATMTGAQALTPGFAPPEQYGQGTDPRTDIYSLGATLFAAVTVDAPPDGLTRAAKNETMIHIRPKNSSVSTGFEAIIQRAMMLSPGERYQQAKEFLDDFNHVEEISAKIRVEDETKIPEIEVDETLVGSAKNISPKSSQLPRADQTIIAKRELEKPKKSLFQQWWVYAILGVILVAGIIGIASLIFNNDPMSLARETTSTPMAATEPIEEITETMINSAAEVEPTLPEVTVEAASTATSAPTIAPTEAAAPTAEAPVIETTPMGGGSGEIAFASDRNGEIQIFLLDVETKEVTQITTMPGGACQPDFSPEGERVVFTSPCAKDQLDYTGSRLFIMNVDGSGLLPLNTLPGGDFDPKWNPADPNQIVFTSYRENSRPHLFIYHLIDRSVSSLSPVIAYDRSPEWSPDGQYIVFQQVYEGVNGIFYMDVETLKRKGLSDLQLESTSPAWSKDGSLIYFSQGKSLPALVGRQFNNLTSPAVNITDIKPVWDVTFSPDGYWIGFMGLGGGTDRDIFMMLNTGGLLENLTNDAAYDFDPVFRP